MLSSSGIFFQNISYYWIGEFRRLVLARSLQASKPAEGEVISESYRNTFFLFKSTYGDI